MQQQKIYTDQQAKKYELHQREIDKVLKELTNPKNSKPLKHGYAKKLSELYLKYTKHQEYVSSHVSANSLDPRLDPAADQQGERLER